MSDESGLGAGGEEPRAQLVIVAFGREDEGGIRIVELACDGEHLRLGETVRVQHHARRVASKALAGKCIDLVDLAAFIHRFLDRWNADGRFRVVSNSMSTQVFGPCDDVLDAVRSELRATFEHLEDEGTGKAVFVMKVFGPLESAGNAGAPVS